MDTRTRPERNLEKLEHEPEKCDWKNDGYTENEIKKMPSRATWPPSSAKWVATSKVKNFN